MSNTEKNDIAGYYIEPGQQAKLRRIMDTLYSDKPLTPDLRRDLANQMHAMMGQIEEQAFTSAQASFLSL
jgi:hypothetical protein